MNVKPDSHVYLAWQSGEVPATSSLLSPCVIGPRIDVFMNEAVDGTYDGTAATFDLPKFSPQYHKPVNYSYLNQCGREWISALEAVYITDTTDSVSYEISNYTLDYGSGTLTLGDDITASLGDVGMLVSEVYTTVIDGTDGITATLTANDDETTFPYFTVNGQQTRVRAGDTIEIPYVYNGKYEPSSSNLGFRTYVWTISSSGTVVYDSDDSATTFTVNVTGSGLTYSGTSNLVTMLNSLNANEIAIVGITDDNKTVYITGTVNTGTTSIDSANIGGDQSFVRGLGDGSTFNVVAWQIIPKLPTVSVNDSDTTVTWDASIKPDSGTSSSYEIIDNDLIHLYFATTVSVGTGNFADYNREVSALFGKVTTAMSGSNETIFDNNGTGGSEYSSSSMSLISVAYSAAWMELQGSTRKIYRRRESGEDFMMDGTGSTGNFIYTRITANNNEFNLNQVVPGVYNGGSDFLCSACTSGDVYVWGFLTNDVPSTATGADVVDVEITYYGRNPSGAYIQDDYVGIYLMTDMVTYDIAPASPSTGEITSTANTELVFQMFTTHGTDALVPPEVNYSFDYEIIRNITGTPKVTYMVFNSYQPSEPIEITQYSDIVNNLGAIHPYNPLGYAAYLMLQNRSNNNHTTSFFVIPVKDMSDDEFGNAITNVLKKFNSNTVVLYELAALSMSDQVHTAMEAFVAERSNPVWSDYRRYWKAVCIPESYKIKVNIGDYSIGASSNVLIDNDEDFEDLNVEVGDYVEAVPDTIYMTLTGVNISITDGATSFIITDSNLASDDNLAGKYVYFETSSGEIITGKINRKVTSTSILVDLDQDIDNAITDTVTVYIFKYWFRTRVVSVDSAHTISVDATLPTTYKVYKLYTQYSVGDLAEAWYAEAQQTNSERVSIVNPWIRTTFENDTYVLPGFYLAAVKAAQASAKANISEPMSGWSLNGIDYVEYGDDFFGPDLFATIVENGIDAHVNMTTNGPIYSHRQRTTYQTTDTTDGRRMQSVVKVVDYLAHQFRKSVEPLTKKYNISTHIADTMINPALQIIMQQAIAGGGTSGIIDPSSRIVLIKPIKKQSDLPDDFVMDSGITFEPGYYIETNIVYKMPIYLIQHKMYISSEEA